MQKLILSRSNEAPSPVSRLHLLQAMTRAETAWMEEIAKVFGARDAGLMRFQKRGAGEPGSLLNTLYLSFAASRERYTSS